MGHAFTDALGRVPPVNGPFPHPRPGSSSRGAPHGNRAVAPAPASGAAGAGRRAPGRPARWRAPRCTRRRPRRRWPRPRGWRASCSPRTPADPPSRPACRPRRPRAGAPARPSRRGERTRARAPPPRTGPPGAGWGRTGPAGALRRMAAITSPPTTSTRRSRPWAPRRYCCTTMFCPSPRIASSAASSDCRLSQIMMPLFSLTERSFTSTGTPPTSLHHVLDAGRLAGHDRPRDRHTSRREHLQDPHLVPAGRDPVGAVHDRDAHELELVHHRQPVLVHGEADARDHDVGAREAAPAPVRGGPSLPQPQLDLERIDDARVLSPRARAASITRRVV